MGWVGKDLKDHLGPTLLLWAESRSSGPEDPKEKLKEQSLLVQCLRRMLIYMPHDHFYLERKRQQMQNQRVWFFSGKKIKIENEHMYSGLAAVFQ